LEGECRMTEGGIGGRYLGVLDIIEQDAEMVDVRMVV